MKRTLLATLVVILLVIMTATASAVTATVTADVLNLRAEPQGEIIGSVRYGEQVEVVNGPDRNWYYQILYKGNVYYAYGTYLDFGTDLPGLPKISDATSQKPTTKPTDASNKWVVPTMYFLDETGYNPIVFVNAKKEISLRRYAEKGSLRLAWVKRGEPVVVIDPKITKGFIKVRTLDGTSEGYTYAKYLSLNPLEGIDYSTYAECEILDESIQGTCWTYAEDEENE